MDKTQIKAISVLATAYKTYEGMHEEISRLHYEEHQFPCEEWDEWDEAAPEWAMKMLRNLSVHVVIGLATAYREGWDSDQSSLQHIDDLKTIYREGERARAEHDLQEKTP